MEAWIIFENKLDKGIGNLSELTKRFIRIIFQFEVKNFCENECNSKAKMDGKNDASKKVNGFYWCMFVNKRLGSLKGTRSRKKN